MALTPLFSMLAHLLIGRLTRHVKIILVHYHIFSGKNLTFYFGLQVSTAYDLASQTRATSGQPFKMFLSLDSE